MSAFSCSNLEQWKSLSEDIKGSITSALDGLFNKSHLVHVKTREGMTQLTFDYVDSGVVKSESVRIPDILFKVEEN